MADDIDFIEKSRILDPGDLSTAVAAEAVTTADGGPLLGLALLFVVPLGREEGDEKDLRHVNLSGHEWVTSLAHPPPPNSESCRVWSCGFVAGHDLLSLRRS